jgi:hypothetical protein
MMLAIILVTGFGMVRGFATAVADRHASRAPRFTEARFQFDGVSQTVSIRVHY